MNQSFRMATLPSLASRLVLITAFGLVTAACGSGADPLDRTGEFGGEGRPVGSETGLKTGAERLVDSGYAVLNGKRVALIANQTTLVGGRHLADLLHDASGVRLVALFGPEHGFRGDNDDGWAIGDTVDAATGVPVYSVYGERRSPPASVLDSIDVLVFDIQDVGARFYTFISTMGLAMQAAAAADVEFIVLDRPNPVGGVRVDGFVREDEFSSFVGLFPIPVQHGMTVGELARMAVGKAWLPGLGGLRLSVIEMTGWSRDMLWSDTDRPWQPTSPNIPTFENALVYPGMCFFEGTTASEGRGTESPFMMVGAPWLDAGSAAARLRAAGLAGIDVEAIRYTPVSIPGKATTPRYMDREIPGLRLTVTDPHAVRPLEVGIHVLAAFVSDPGRPDDFFGSSRLARLAGTERLERQLGAGSDPRSVVESWSAEVTRFVEARRPYLLYD